MSALLAGLLVAYWHHYRRRYGLVGHLFQGHSKTPAIETDSYLLSCGRYIERNPLVAGLVRWPWDYAWSSCRAYALGEANGLLAENPWYQELAAEPVRRQQLWQSFLLGEDAKEKEFEGSDWVLGSAGVSAGDALWRGAPGTSQNRPAQPAAEWLRSIGARTGRIMSQVEL